MSMETEIVVDEIEWDEREWDELVWWVEETW
ncbi:hypothetical protein STSO111631_21425 [Stackebrandtia soli]